MSKDTKSQQITKAFVQNASEDCVSCEKLKTSMCPLFRKAVEDGAKPKDLKQAVDAIQNGRDLTGCS